MKRRVMNPGLDAARRRVPERQFREAGREVGCLCYVTRRHERESAPSAAVPEEQRVRIIEAKTM